MQKCLMGALVVYIRKKRMTWKDKKDRDRYLGRGSTVNRFEDTDKNVKTDAVKMWKAIESYQVGYDFVKEMAKEI